jgi:hypothetical protein
MFRLHISPAPTNRQRAGDGGKPAGRCTPLPRLARDTGRRLDGCWKSRRGMSAAMPRLRSLNRRSVLPEKPHALNLRRTYGVHWQSRAHSVQVRADVQPPREKTSLNGFAWSLREQRLPRFSFVLKGFQGRRERASSASARSSNSRASSSSLLLTVASVTCRASRRHRSACSRSFCAGAGVSGIPWRRTSAKGL